MKITLSTTAAYWEVFNLCFYRQGDSQSSVNEKLCLAGADFGVCCISGQICCIPPGFIECEG